MAKRFTVDELLERAMDAVKRDYPASDPAEVLIAILRTKAQQPEKIV